MWENIYIILKNLVSFTLICSLLLNLVEDSAYEKYIRFFCGIIFLLLMVQPVRELINGDYSFEQEIKQEMAKYDRQEIERELLVAEEGKKRQMEEEYDKALEEEIREYLVWQGIVSEQHDIEKVEVELEEEETGWRIKDIHIELKTFSGDSKYTDSQWKQILARTYDIKPSQIHLRG